MKINNRNVYVFDNGGETIDRYFILIGSTGDYYTASRSPGTPWGMGQYGGNVVEEQMEGTNWREILNVKSIIKREIKYYLSETRDLCRRLTEIQDVDRLPEDVLIFIQDKLKNK